MRASVAAFVLAMTTFALVTTVPELAIAQGLSDLAGVVGGSKTEAEPVRTIAPTSSTPSSTFERSTREVRPGL